MSFTTRQARKELDKLERKLKGYESLLIRKGQLEAFLSLAEKLSARPKSKPQAAPEPVTRHMRTLDVAGQVLERNGAMHLDAIYQQMRSLGWTGSGNAVNEKKAIYVAMLREPQRFIRVGRNIWTIRREIQDKAAS